MNLVPLDIACYVYCPVLCKQGKHSKISPPLTFAEQYIRKAFINAERNAVLKDNIVSPRNLLAAWDKIWWPAATGVVTMQIAEEISLNASQKFTDYCKYDLSDYMFPTVGAGIECQLRIRDSILSVTADIIKVDLNRENNNTVIVDFSRKNLTASQAARDPAIQSTAYSFYKGRDETIFYISVDISEKLNKIRIVESIFRPDDMEQIRRMLHHVEHGIRTDNYYMNPYLCERCQECPNFTS